VRSLLLALAVALSALALPQAARADGDGLYGRFDGDFRLSVAAGGGARIGARTVGIGLVELRARYLDSAGVFVTGDSDDGAWRVTAGVELRPLFPARFLLGLESGARFFDLLVDSFTLELGIAATRLSTDPLAGVVLGVGFDVPLVAEPFRLAVHLGFRWTYEAQRRLPDETDIALLAALVVDFGVRTGLAPREGPRSIAVP